MSRFKDAIINDICGDKISDNIYLDNNGQLICSNCVLARTGSYDYHESELIDGGSDEKVVKVYRDESEVFDPVSIKSMNFKPLVNDHPDDNVTPDTVGDLQKGFMTNVRRGEGEFDGCLIGDLVVTDPEVIDLVLNKQKRDLSVGYTADIDEENGRYVMKNIRGNHIALCAAGRAGNARIRDSVPVKDAFVIEFPGGGYVGPSGWTKNIENAMKYSSRDEAEEVAVKKSRDGNSLLRVKSLDAVSVLDSSVMIPRGAIGLGGDSDIKGYESRFGVKIDANDYQVSVSGSRDSLLKFIEFMIPKNSQESVKGPIRDAVVSDFEAKGQFGSLDDLKSFYKNANVSSDGMKVFVSLATGEKLEYQYMGSLDTSRLIFIRKVNDSIRDGVEVLGDSHKLRVGQRVEYFGLPSVIVRIKPDTETKEFLVSFSTNTQATIYHAYSDVCDMINMGKIKLLDSVVFDSDAGVFKFEANDADDYATTGAGKLVANAMNELGIVSKKDLLSRKQEVIAKMQSMSSGYGRMQLGWFVENYANRVLKDCDTSEDYSDSFKDKYADCFADTAGEMKLFRVSVGDRKFDTRAHSAAEAMAKVRAAVKDAMPKNYVMYRPSTGNYLQNGSSILSGQIYEGAGVGSAARFDPWYVDYLLQELNNVMKKLGHRADWVLKEITPKDLGLSDELIQLGSKEALSKNIATEIKAGKDPKQAAAIAHSVQRKNDASEPTFKFAGKDIPKSPYEADLYWMKFGGTGVLRYSLKTKSGQITTSHPYDETEYHWAKSTDGRRWDIIYRGSIAGSFSGDAEAVLKELVGRDKAKNLGRKGGIW